MADDNDGTTRRDFIHVASVTAGALGAACVAWPFIDQMNPAADTLALSSTEFDVSGVEEGMAVSIVWRGKPVFIRHRTKKEIQEASEVQLDELPDPQADSDRTSRPEMLVLLGVCTHLGCVPLGQSATDPKGEWGDGFVHVMVLITIPQEESVRGQPQQTLPCRRTNIYLIVLLRSAEEQDNE